MAGGLGALLLRVNRCAIAAHFTLGWTLAGRSNRTGREDLKNGFLRRI